MRCDHGFEPVFSNDAVVFILGSMPGRESLKEQQYYAHPRNGFWPIMGALFDAGPEVPYSERLLILKKHKIALWDVVGRCRRKGSLDSNIDKSSIQPNDFSQLVSECPDLQHIFFNGAMAEQLFVRHIFKSSGKLLQGISLKKLPSTSPANASFSYQQKLGVWTLIRTALENS